MLGETPTMGIVADGRLETSGDKVKEADLEAGAVVILWSRGVDGCCLIRRSPERPSPCSPPCSGIMGDLLKVRTSTWTWTKI
jgi:hypothetical protein